MGFTRDIDFYPNRYGVLLSLITATYLLKNIACSSSSSSSEHCMSELDYYDLATHNSCCPADISVETRYIARDSDKMLE